MSSKNFIFTMNNPKVELKELWDEKCMKCLVGQLEVGESGTPHLQFVVVYLKDKKNPKILGAHSERTRDLKASLAYCQKEETRSAGPWIYGTLPAQQGGDHKTTKMEYLQMSKQEIVDNPDISMY